MMVFEKLLGLLAPFTCLSCGEEGSLLCDWCRPDTLLPLPSRCYRCMTATTESAVCATCRKQTRLRHVWVATEYEGAAKQLVSRLKFERASAAADVMAVQLDAVLPYLPPDTVVVHVPTATSRVRMRGYDQAQLVARALARRRGWRAMQLLARLGQTRQVGAVRETRRRQLQQAYLPRNHAAIRGAKLLLIDDVLTTGATIEAAARTLREAGAQQVDAALFAQKTGAE